MQIDNDSARNKCASAVHTLMSRDGTPPAQLRAICHDELKKYTTVTLVHDTVIDVSGERGNFVVACESGRSIGCKIVLLACGTAPDELPDIVKTLVRRERTHGCFVKKVVPSTDSQNTTSGVKVCMVARFATVTSWAMTARLG